MDCQVLVAGRNFGCGSSREHAPWALMDYGIRAVISTEIADIFRTNSLKNGLVPVTVNDATAAWLLEHPGAEVDIDLEAARLTLPSGAAVDFPIEAFARHCLLNGLDELGYLRSKLPDIERFEAARGNIGATRLKALIAVLAGRWDRRRGHRRSGAGARRDCSSASVIPFDSSPHSSAVPPSTPRANRCRTRRSLCAGARTRFYWAPSADRSGPIPTPPCGQNRDCCSCARRSDCSPICARSCRTRRCSMPRPSRPSSCAASTSWWCAS